MQAVKQARDAVICSVCGKPFTSPRSSLTRGYGKICSKECREQWRLQRGRGRDGRPWQEVVEQIRAFGLPALERALAAPAPEILWRFYGLADGKPWTQQAIAAILGLRKGDVQRILTAPAVNHLLGEPGHRQDRARITMLCAICGTGVERSPRQVRDRVLSTTCGPICRQEWLRRQAARLTANDANALACRANARESGNTRVPSACSTGCAGSAPCSHTDALRALSPQAYTSLPGSSDMWCASTTAWTMSRARSANLQVS